ncbi:nucleotidyltransferase domain-containing protein [Neobacillus drentensis]|uniref:nucleotidyltransferase domain-containing protein n=1 Tax=Neobacillus drentensis TaxID=220684 RepID=UPI001F2BEF6F|nr:nucleotidyltransferase domain-containing protein [Neobacillus drentensis]ULT58354.1 nucleotidyltransferase domain-containing protein [Neobacillus drentensis]
MKERIIEELKRIEQEFEVKICYAVEAGSRAWGTSSQHSDYDIRFIYVHKKDWYLTIDQKRDVIEEPINDQLDLNGWDLRKALQLFKKSNPSLLEWLHSDIVYYQGFSLLEKMKKLENEIFQPKASLFHYLNMAKGNYRNGPQTETISSKRYLTIIRPILSSMWIKKYNNFPPNELPQLIEELIKEKEVKRKIHKLIKNKINHDDPYINLDFPIIHDFIDKEMNHLEEYARKLVVPKRDYTNELNVLFREMLEEVWS